MNEGASRRHPGMRARAQPAPAASAPGVRVRVEAARAIVRVTFGGESLRAVLADVQPGFADARDRALLAASLFAAARRWLRHDAAVDRLTATPLPTKAREVRALLVVALAQLVDLAMPAHAVVAAAVDAAHALGHPRHAGLVNAVLRRFLRERAAVEAALDVDPVTRFSHPRWLIEAIGADWPEHTEAILRANDTEAPLTLRVHRRRSTRDALLTALANAGMAAQALVATEEGIVLAESTDVTRLPGYAEGWFSVQDGAAQRVADALDLRDGLRVLDACAAPGGKTAHVLERVDAEVLALDCDAQRLRRVESNLARLGLHARVQVGDALTPPAWWDGQPFDRILVDAPCSASGIVRRQPDIKLHRRASDMAPLAATQSALLAALWPLLAPGGRLVYATCSILRAENEAVTARFLATHADAEAIALPARFGHGAGVGRQTLPGEDGMDGFHIAAFAKAAR